LRGTLFEPRSPTARGLILIHMLGSDRLAWERFAIRARNDGFVVLSFDLRGHGKSRGAGAARVSYRSFDGDAWRRAEPDIGEAKKALIARGVSPREIGIVGASIGANLATRYAASDPDIAALVLLSPGESYRDVQLLPAIDGYGERPILAMAAEGDSYAAETARAVKDRAADHCEVRLYKGTAHGTDLLAAHGAASGQILLWLSQILHKQGDINN